MNPIRWLGLSARNTLRIVIVAILASMNLLVWESWDASAAEPTPQRLVPNSIPLSIQSEARRRGVALSSIKRQGDQWVACEGAGAEATCLVLGLATPTAPLTQPAAQTVAPQTVRLTGLSNGSVLDVYQYGQAKQTIVASENNAFGKLVRSTTGGVAFELYQGIEARVVVQGRPSQAIDTMPKYRREGTNLVRTNDFAMVRNYIDARPQEPFTIIVTVPALCEPCRRLDALVHEHVGNHRQNSNHVANQREPNALLMKTFILEYTTFVDAEREVLGSGAIFPTTLVYGAEPQPRRSLTRLIGNLRGSSMEEISRSLSDRFRRGSPHTMARGVISEELLFPPASGRLTQR